MGAVTRMAPVLLQHVSLLLMLFAGACLASAARLKWDPVTYVAARELAPAEYRWAARGLLAGGLALAALAHVALAALALPPARALRRRLLYAYAGCMWALVAGEAWLVTWAWLQAAAWLRSEDARRLRETLELREHVAPILAYFAKWHPVPERLRELIEEAEADVPRNGYCACAAAAALLLLQLAAGALALAAARHSPRPPSYSKQNGAGGADAELLRC